MRVAARPERGDEGAMLVTCQAGYENFLARELEGASVRVAERGPGWVLTEENSAGATSAGGRRAADEAGLGELAFAHLSLLAPAEVRGESVNALAQGVAEFFLESLRGEKIEAAWPCVWRGPQELVGLGRRMGGVEAAFRELLEKKLRRVARLAVNALPQAARNGQSSTLNVQCPDAGGSAGAGEGGRGETASLRDGGAGARGLFVFFTDFGRAWAAREAWAHGQRRMADDELAPSRSYLKMEEAYGVIGMEPQAGETVCDLGAAPGGWSYSAAKRGARVVAVDNGPLKGGALNHPLIEHRLADAFGFCPADGERFDWLFCDVVEEPHHVLKNLVGPWLERGWCRRFVVNLKFGRADPLGLLRELRGPGSVFSRHAGWFAVRHLYHDREEFTVVGETRAAQ
jgi:23S rRNA (cytidine2498-2'-O)-methyltransferase